MLIICNTIELTNKIIVLNINIFNVFKIIVLSKMLFNNILKIKKYTKDNIPVDLKLFIQTQRVNVKKISYKKLMRLVAIINAVDIGIILLITNLVSNLFLKLLIAIPAIFIVLYISYTLAGKILKKKGMTLNES